MNFKGNNREKLFALVKRTKENLEWYYQENYKFEVTQTINSMLGMIVIPCEKGFPNEVDEMMFEEIDPDMVLREVYDEAEYGSFQDFLIHLRNAVSHGGIEFMEPEDKIKQVWFKSSGYRRENHCSKFSVEQLHYFIINYAEALLKRLQKGEH